MMPVIFLQNRCSIFEWILTINWKLFLRLSSELNYISGFYNIMQRLVIFKNFVLFKLVHKNNYFQALMRDSNYSFLHCFERNNACKIGKIINSSDFGHSFSIFHSFVFAAKEVFNNCPAVHYWKKSTHVSRIAINQLRNIRRNSDTDKILSIWNWFINENGWSWARL